MFDQVLIQRLQKHSVRYKKWRFPLIKKLNENECKKYIGFECWKCTGKIEFNS